MPHHFKFEPEHRILLTVVEGDIDGSEIQTIDREMRAAIDRTRPSAGISDLTAVSNFDVPSQIMRNAALQQPPPFPADTPRFIVASSDFLFGMMRMYELIANRPLGKLMVVRCMEDALATIGVSNARFELLE
jgi:hypothetical protein